MCDCCLRKLPLVLWDHTPVLELSLLQSISLAVKHVSLVKELMQIDASISEINGIWKDYPADFLFLSPSCISFLCSSLGSYYRWISFCSSGIWVMLISIKIFLSKCMLISMYSWCYLCNFKFNWSFLTLEINIVSFSFLNFD